MAERPSLFDQLDRIHKTRDFVDFDKDLADLDTFVDQAPRFHFSEPSPTGQQITHIKEYYNFVKSYDKYLRVKDIVTDPVLQDAAFPLNFVKLEKQLTL